MMKIIVGRGRSKATQRLEINDPTVSREHCWLSDNGDGTYTLENKSAQGTMVNGRQILKTKVTANTFIQLSPNTTVRVADLLPLQSASSPHVQTGAPPQPSAPEYSIKHLQYVWDEYHGRILDIQRNQHSINVLRSASPLFTLGSGAVAALARALGWGDSVFSLTIILTVIGLGLMAYSFVKGFNDHSIDDRERATEDFQSKYVCPNPKCHQFMGNTPYSLLRQKKCCPSCRCKFTVK